jgi:hypothetical protein
MRITSVDPAGGAGSTIPARKYCLESRFQGTSILDERTHLPEGPPWHQIAVDATEDNSYATFLGNAGGQRTVGQGAVRRFTGK